MANSFDELLAGDQAGFDQIYKMALGRELRKDPPVTSRWGDALSEIGSDIADKMRLREAEQARQAELAKRRESILSYVASNRPELLELAKVNPAGAIKLLQDDAAEQMQLDAARRFQGVFRGGGGGGGPAPSGPEQLGSAENYAPGEFQVLKQTGGGGGGRPGITPYEEVAPFLGVKNPILAKQAADYIQRYHPHEVDPTKFRPNAEGTYVPVEGSVGFAGDVARAKAVAEATATPATIDERRTPTGILPVQSRAALLGLDRAPPAVFTTALGTPPAEAPPAAPQGGGQVLAESVRPTPQPTARTAPRGSADDSMTLEMLGSLSEAAKAGDAATVAQYENALKNRGIPAEVIAQAKTAPVQIDRGQAAPAQPKRDLISMALESVPSTQQLPEVIKADIDVNKDRQLNMTKLQSARSALEDAEKLSPKIPSGATANVEYWWNKGIGAIKGDAAKERKLAGDVESFESLIGNVYMPMLRPLLGGQFGMKEHEDFKTKFPSLMQEESGRKQIIDYIKGNLDAQIEENAVYDAAVRAGKNANQAVQKYWELWGQENKGRTVNPFLKGTSGGQVPGKISAAESPENVNVAMRSEDDPYWSLNAQAGGTTLPLTRNAQGLPIANPSPKGGESQAWDITKNAARGFRDAWTNTQAGLQQNLPEFLLPPGMPPLNEEDIRLLNAARAPEKEKPGYAAGEVAGSIVNPINLPFSSNPITAGIMGIGQGYVAPWEDRGQQARNMVGTTAGSVLGSLVGKVLPSTGAAKDLVPEDVNRMMKEFPSFSPTAAQLNPKDPISAVGRAVGVNASAAERQMAQITKDVADRIGIKEGVLTPKSVADNIERIRNGNTATGEVGFNGIFKKSDVVSPDISTSLAFRQLEKSDPRVARLMATTDAEELQKVYNAFKNGAPVDMKTLHEGYLQLDKVSTPLTEKTVATVREFLHSQIEKELAAKSLPLDTFRKLNKEYRGTLAARDLVQASGVTPEGLISPAKLEALSKKIDLDSSLGQANQLMQKFSIENPGFAGGESMWDAVTRRGLTGTMGTVATSLPIVGGLASLPSKAGHIYGGMTDAFLTSPEGIKMVIEGLRAAPQIGARGYATTLPEPSGYEKARRQ
jgi:hypothetical protein